VTHNPDEELTRAMLSIVDYVWHSNFLPVAIALFAMYCIASWGLILIGSKLAAKREAAGKEPWYWRQR